MHIMSTYSQTVGQPTANTTGAGEIVDLVERDALLPEPDIIEFLARLAAPAADDIDEADWQLPSCLANYVTHREEWL
jgi:hypothetical protein